ncbi:spermidine/putrescine ABC transporter substrate-binding protein [Oceanicella sp. SM1341]|uniref:polyamine ABC transporter substrate-binding protein n=1 Tax=Oceanicella sp. SM1341 TaxID=1548889 RepID=UPI000E53B8A0|nr:spermidine/putrescine ABC transporter substrate-binding protein [Oceanicella sp. SM1341]
MTRFARAAGLSALALTAVSVALSAAPAPAQEKIVISNWDGYMPDDLPDKFEAETGIAVEVALHATNEEIMGKVVAGGGRGYDVLFVSSPFAEALGKMGLLAPLDPGLVPNFANLYPEAMELPYDPGNTFSAPYAWGTTGLCYRSDLVEDPPSSWNDLLSPAPELEGRVTMLSTDRWLMAAGLLAKGFSVNDTDPGHIAEVKETLIAARKTLLSYDDTTFYSKLVSGEASLVHAWDGWCNYGIAEDRSIRYVIPEEGTDLWVDTMVVPEASENKEAAQAFINYVLGAETGAWVVENILYKVPNRAAMEAADPGLYDLFPNLGMQPSELMRQEALRDLGEGQRLYSRAVTEIMAAN